VVELRRSGRQNGPGRFWGTMIRLAVLVSAGATLRRSCSLGCSSSCLLLGDGVALHFNLRRRLRQAGRRSWDGVIDVEYTIVERRQ
jgi:hypothetical protein